MIKRTMPLEPVIKWSGSKRTIASFLARLFPESKRYFEPFVGGGAMLPFRPSQVSIAGDIIPELIELWKVIRDAPELVANEYEIRWNRLQAEGHTAYYAIRESFNFTRNPHDLLFLTRTCVNGLIRFNSNREFNNSFHHSRPGIAPFRLCGVLSQWSRALKDVEFIAADYRSTLESVDTGDLIFLDPPYGSTRGRYIPNKFDLDGFYGELERLNSIGAKWVLTFDGEAGRRAYSTKIPRTLYKSQFALQTGNSPFTKLMKTGIDPVVESVYLNFDLPTKLSSEFANLRNQSLGILATSKMQQGRMFD